MKLAERDAKVMWHPFTQAQLEGLPIPIVRASGAKLTTEDGREIIDAVSSWWVNIHGHSHPYIAAKISEQAARLEHVIFAGFTHEPAVRLAEALLAELGGDQARIFYSDNGSTAVETALKMALQYLSLTKRSGKGIVSLRGAYHGDTFGAMSANEQVHHYKPFEGYLFPVYQVNPPQGLDDECVHQFENLLREQSIGVFIYEPLIQGVAGMRMYDPAALNRMLELCERYHVVTIADEVFTGFGRTGKYFASDYIRTKPDIICLSKGISGGFLPLGVTSAREDIFRAFQSMSRSTMFFHGHSYTANPLACAAALASMELLSKDTTWERIGFIERSHRAFMPLLADISFVKHAAVLGTILRFEIETPDSGYESSIRDIMYKKFIERGVLLRPLGNVLYVLPPYCITERELQTVYEAIQSVLNEGI